MLVTGYIAKLSHRKRPHGTDSPLANRYETRQGESAKLSVAAGGEIQQ
jgi:hypothetical protein